MMINQNQVYVSIATNPVSLRDLSSGVGRTGALCLLYAAVQELEAGNSIPDLPHVTKTHTHAESTMPATNMLNMPNMAETGEIYNRT